MSVVGGIFFHSDVVVSSNTCFRTIPTISKEDKDRACASGVVVSNDNVDSSALLLSIVLTLLSLCGSDSSTKSGTDNDKGVVVLNNERPPCF